MSTGPFDVSAVVARLQANAPSLRKIAGAAERAAAETDAGMPTPSAYVLLARERPSPHAGASSQFRQRVECTFGVVVAIKNVRLAELGMQANETLNTVVGQIRAALLGWRPTETSTACELAGAELQSYSAGVMWWVEGFSFNYFAIN